MDAILKKARGREALKVADEVLQDDDRDFDQAGEPDETGSPTSASEDTMDDLFDPEKDLSIRVGRETLAQVLSLETDMNVSFYLECRKTGPAGRDGIRIVGRLVDLESA